MKGSIARRVAGFVGMACALACLVLVFLLAGGDTASAAPTQQSFSPSRVPVVFSATGPGGAPVSVTVLVAASELVTATELASLPFPALPAGETYFHVWLQPQRPVGAPLVPLSIPTADASLSTNGGTATAVGIDPGPGSIDAQWYFPVADSITSATLAITPSTVIAYGANGSQTPYAIQATSIDFVTKPPVTTPTPIPTGAPSGNQGLAGSPALTTKSTGISSSASLGVGLGGLVVLGVGAVIVVTLARRRAFYRADREGRVVLVGPPTLSPAAVAARLHGSDAEGGGAGVGDLPRTRHGIVVKILGWLEVEGTKEPITAGPLLELIVYLVLNPGRSFTSVQIRESVWVLGRQPITSATFRKYMVYLRKQFGPGVVVTDRFHYELTDAVISDWDLFQAALAVGDHLAGPEKALALVRGPVLHGSFDGKKNSPFAWAYDEANSIEHQVTTTAVELARARLELDDASRAARATAQGLICANTNLELRKVDLLVGAALGGPREVGRRLEGARVVMADFPGDMVKLEELAGQLGWQAIVSG
jgi:DNA-binding SARP family transcriptional activator